MRLSRRIRESVWALPQVQDRGPKESPREKTGFHGSFGETRKVFGPKTEENEVNQKEEVAPREEK